MPGDSFSGSSAPAWLAPARTLGRALLDLLYPPRCAACGRPGVFFCPECLAKLERLPLTRCPRCGSPAGEAGGLCRACRTRPVALNGILSTGPFAPPLRPAIHAFKYRGLRALSETFAQWLADTWQAARLQADLVVPVPLHPSRRAERGYNQAELLAADLAPRLALASAPGALTRERATATQVEMTWQERQANVQGAFACHVDMTGLRVLLVDDVCTTGATLEACAEALRSRGAATVWGLTVARAMDGRRK